jgi:membrane protease YdiL (CAAX protease family)
LFRGYLFRHLRGGRTFRDAALLSMVPFVLVHLVMFATLPWAVALAATVLAVIVSVPLAYLFELGGWTIWAPAIVHFVIQGALKVIVIPDGAVTELPIIWMAAAAVVPFMAFAIPRAAVATARP